MRIALSAGHGLRDPGAVNTERGLCEHLESYKIVWFLRDVLERQGHQVEFVSCFQSLASKIREVNELHAVQPVDLALEIHFNSADDLTANGTEVLYLSAKNKERAASISASVSKSLGTKDRGAVRRGNLGWLNKTTPPALIVEVLFIQADEAGKILAPDFHGRVAGAIARGITA